MLRSFPERTSQRKLALLDYMQQHVLDDGGFKCRHYDQCRASCNAPVFYEGQLSHVGNHYDLELDGRPLRIVIIGQEYGHDPSRVSLQARAEIIGRAACAGFSSKYRTPHLKGTASILRLLLGRESGADRAGEILISDDHIYDGFALVNFLLCSATNESKTDPTVSSKGAAKGKSSRAMRQNCSRHFISTLRILRPTIIVIQGIGVRDWIMQFLGWPLKGQVFQRIEVENHPVDIFTFVHPSASGKYGWWGNSPRSSYLNEVVRPAIREYLQFD